MRQLVRVVLPPGKDTVLDTFAGAGSTLAAANRVGYDSIGVEVNREYFEISRDAIPALERLK